MVDIHTHILPCVDDGSGSLEESLCMIKAAYVSGTKKIILTPHLYNERTGLLNSNEIEQKFNSFCDIVKNNNIEAKLYLGSEVYCSEQFLNEINKKNFFTLNNSKYLLTEFDFFDDADRVLLAADRVVKAGYIPVVAHPERYSFLRKDKYTALQLLNKGCLFQINKTSLLGLHGESAYEFSMWLINGRYVSFIASDCHDMIYRSPEIEDVFSWVFSNISKNYAERIFYENPELILNNKEIHM